MSHEITPYESIRNSTDFLAIIKQEGKVCYELTKHAQKALEERGIQIEWLERTLSTPECILPDSSHATVERYFCPIPEFGDRILRVAVNTSVEPNRVVSVFFDRAMKGKL